MYQDTQTRVKTRCDTTEYFDIEVGLHQGSALIPLLFITVMNVLASEVGTHPPWKLLFADDLDLRAESSVEVEDELWKWRRLLTDNGIKIRRWKIKYQETKRTVNNCRFIQLFGLNHTSKGVCEKDVTNRSRTGWNR